MRTMQHCSCFGLGDPAAQLGAGLGGGSATRPLWPSVACHLAGEPSLVVASGPGAVREQAATDGCARIMYIMVGGANGWACRRRSSPFRSGLGLRAAVIRPAPRMTNTSCGVVLVVCILYSNMYAHLMMPETAIVHKGPRCASCAYARCALCALCAADEAWLTRQALASCLHTACFMI